MKSKPIYKRVLLKLTGEALKSNRYDLEPKAARSIAEEIKSIYVAGVDVGIVVGGGNIARGEALVKNRYFNMERTDADDIGMIATLINAVFLKSALKDLDVNARILSALEIKKVAELFILGRALKHLDKKRVTIFACGTGEQFLTTDTAAVIRANQIKADAILKCTHIDGVYNDDPVKNKKAKLIRNITYKEVLRKQLGFMDVAAIDLAMKIFGKPLHVFNIFQRGNLYKVTCGEKIGSKVSHAIQKPY